MGSMQGESYDFEDQVTSPAAARRFVRELLASWGMSDLTEIVELLVSEVVTNVVRHARTDGSIVVTRSAAGVRVEVSDFAGGEPAPLSPEPRQPSGRGLSIVDAMASRWGVATAPDGSGKAVWFEVDAQPAESGT